MLASDNVDAEQNDPFVKNGSIAALVVSRACFHKRVVLHRGCGKD